MRSIFISPMVISLSMSAVLGNGKPAGWFPIDLIQYSLKIAPPQDAYWVVCASLFRKNFHNFLWQLQHEWLSLPTFDNCLLEGQVQHIFPSSSYLGILVNCWLRWNSPTPFPQLIPTRVPILVKITSKFYSHLAAWRVVFFLLFENQLCESALGDKLLAFLPRFNSLFAHIVSRIF